MFHRETIKKILTLPIHELLFYVFLFLIPIQTRILYQPQAAYIDWYFNYHLAFFVYLTDLVLILCFITWAMFERPRFHLPDRQAGVERIHWLMLAFILVSGLSLFHVKHLDFGLYQLFKWMELWGLVFYVKHNFQNQIQYSLAAVVIFVSAVIQAGIGLIQFHVQHMIGLTWLGEYVAPAGTPGLASITLGTEKIIRAYGTMPHPNVLGGFLVFGLFMGLFLVSRETFSSISNEVRDPSQKGFLANRSKWFPIFLVSCLPAKALATAGGTILITLGIFVTFSRLAWIGAIIGYIGFILYMFHLPERLSSFSRAGVKHIKMALIIGVIGVVSCATILIFGYPYLKARATDLNSVAVSDRASFNRMGWELIKEQPWLGVGVGNYVPALQERFELESWAYQPAHNIFIFIAAETGWIGLAIFMWILWEIGRRIKHPASDPVRFTIYLLLITFLLMGQFDHYFVTIQQGRLLMFTLLGLLAGLPNLNERGRHSGLDPESKPMDPETSSG